MGSDGSGTIADTILGVAEADKRAKRVVVKLSREGSTSQPHFDLFSIHPRLGTGSPRRSVRRFTAWAQEAKGVGAENPVTSCDVHVLIYESAESVSSQRPDCRAGGWGSGACRRVLVE